MPERRIIIPKCSDCILCTNLLGYLSYEVFKALNNPIIVCVFTLYSIFDTKSTYRLVPIFEVLEACSAFDSNV